MPREYRNLSPEEIRQLAEQRCRCQNWSKVLVSEGFKASAVNNTIFSGEIRLGVFEKTVTFCGGVVKETGISNATIHNCTIGDNVFIDRIKSYIANYEIEDGVIIENIDLLVVNGKSSFGNGTEVAVLNEVGGREIPIYDNLSAHTAYIIAFYRHRPVMIENLRNMIAKYTKSVTSSMGVIGKETRILNSRTIKNVKIGPYCTIEGVDRLENGSVNSCKESPVYIGPSVIAENFIVCSGSRISDGTLIFHCFIGQGCELAKQYSAEHSVFFANCLGFHGEACAIFAGPYTVTHHKSTLLIAGLFSFLNAGSGSNQSNHMYKLGPVHQGVVERGSRTTSDSYMLWPAKVGAFTVVMGRHYRNSDTSNLPFSYLIEHEDESILVPGVNLRSVGTIRDARKWPKRDKRKDPNKLDHINFKLLSPYTIQKMLNGIEILRSLKATSGATSDYFIYHSVKIKKSSLDNGIEFYQMAVTKFLGNTLIKKLEGIEFKNNAELKEKLKAGTDKGIGHWVDVAGLFAPQRELERVLDDIESGKLGTIEDIRTAFKSMHENYPEYEWSWTLNVLQQYLGKTIDCIEAGDIIEVVNCWKKSVVKLDNLLESDAMKEFSATAKTSYGLDGNEAVKNADFAQVRGKFEENSFVLEIGEHIKKKAALGDELIGRLQKLC